MKRRNLLGGAAAMPALAIAPLAGIPIVTDPHAAWLAEWHELDRITTELSREGYDLGDCEGTDQWYATADRIMETPAETFDGAMVQLRMAGMAAKDIPGVGHDAAKAGLLNAIATSERLGAGGVT